MKNKNKFIILSLLIFVLGLIVYFNKDFKRGNIESLKVTIVDSEIYEEEEIEEAIDIVLEKFKRVYKGCNLRELYYEDNKEDLEGKTWTNQYNKDQGIVLISSFDVDSKGAEASLNPNTTYENWKWILVRNKDNKEWELKTWGF